MKKIHDILEHSDTNGTIPTLNFLENELDNINSLIHLIKVIDFCDILKILLEYGLYNSHCLKLKIIFFVKNEKYLFMKYDMYNSENEQLNKKKLNYKKNEHFKKLVFGIDSMLDKFQNTSVKFYNTNLIEQPLEIFLNIQNIEILRTYFLNKELFSAYQSFYLNKQLQLQGNKQNLKKI